LRFSFVGFTSQEIPVNNQTEINIKLKESVLELNAVSIISTGYQEISREKMTGAADVVNRSFYENAYRPTLQEGLQGSVAGLQILNNNSHPQALPQVIIRGVGSAFGEGVGVAGFSGQPSVVLGNPPVLTPGSPLYIIDGLPTFDGRDLSVLNGNDIKSITVLKDAAATSIYGARAANGVIVIETKSGRSGKARFNYSTQIGFSNFTELNRPLNSSQLQELYIEGLINNATNGINDATAALNFLSNPPGALRPFNVNQNTDWGDVLTRNGVMTQHNLSSSGGNESSNYYLSIGYLENESPLKEINFNRLNIRLKYNNRLSERLNVMTNIGYGNTKSNNHETGSSFYNPFRSIYQVRPDFRVFNENESYNTNFNFGVNPLGILTDERRQLQTNDFRGVFDINYKILEGLTFETNIGTNYSLNENYNRFPSYLGIGFNRGGDNYGNQLNTNNFNWNSRALLRYDLNFGEGNNLNVFVGTERNANITSIMNSSVRGLRTGAVTLDNGITENTFTSRVETAIASVFSNAVYDYQGKYIVSGSLRRDGSSRFGDNNKYGVFYAIGLGWNIHEELFMRSFTAFNILKLRTSYGINGNDQIGLFGYSGTFNTTGFYNNLNASTIESSGNASIGWEKNASFDIGIDYGVFNNRISGSIDYYNRQTSGLL
jgi:TonB-linked SusC/RagA family outer membrane protein